MSWSQVAHATKDSHHQHKPPNVHQPLCTPLTPNENSQDRPSNLEPAAHLQNPTASQPLPLNQASAHRHGGPVGRAMMLPLWHTQCAHPVTHLTAALSRIASLHGDPRWAFIGLLDVGTAVGVAEGNAVRVKEAASRE